MQRLELPNNTNLPFPEMIGRIADYLLPFTPMWRTYWLQAVAVRGGETWHLCHLALVGQWSEFPDAERFCDYIPGGALIAVSQPVDEVRFREILVSLRTTGTIALPHDITATAPSGTVSFLPSWQEQVRRLPDSIEAVAESAIWRDVHVSDSILWLESNRSQDDRQAEMRISTALRADLDRRSERDFGTFLSNKFAARKANSNTLYLTHFYYYLDFPLGLVVEPGPGDQTTQTRPLIVKCRPPLTLDELQLTASRTWTSDAPLLPIEPFSPDASLLPIVGPLLPRYDGWSYGKITVPYLRNRVWLTYESTLGKSLSFDLAVPTPESQARDVIGYIYNYGAQDKGLEGWSNDLLYSDSTKFELALLTALTRLGVPALFAGQLEGKGKTKGQPTPGFDLVVLDHEQRRAVAISAKGSTHSPGYDEVQSTVEGVKMLGQLLPGWRVHGIIACHAPSSRLGQFVGRPDVVVWSLENVAFLLDADTYNQIDGMLWTAPSSFVPHSYLR